MNRYHPTSSNWASHLDDENDSDTDSKVSGSLAVDKAWKVLQEKGYRKSTGFLDDEFAIDPIGDTQFNGSQDNGPLSGDHWETELMGAKTTSDVKSVTQLMTGNDTTQRTPKQQNNTTTNTTQPPATNGSHANGSHVNGSHVNDSHANGYMPQKSPPMSNFHKTPPGSHGKPSPLMQRRMEANAINHARQRSAEQTKQSQQYPNNNFGHLRSGSTPNQVHGGHYSPRMQHRQFLQPQPQQQQQSQRTGLQRPVDSYHTSMQMGNMGYHGNIDQTTLPKWGHSSDGGAVANNNSGARVVEVASPELHTNERIRRPSGPGRLGYPSSTNPPKMYDRRRSEDAAFVQLHNRISPYPHKQQSQPTPHHPTPMSPVSHSKSTEFPRSNGYFDGPPSLPTGMPIAPASSSGMMSSNLSRSISSGYVWKDEQALALDQDPHHMHAHMRRSGSIPRSEGSSSTREREPELNDVIEFLHSGDPNVVANAASYLQHLAYGDDNMKSRIREFGAIPVLINQLNYPDMKVQLAVLGALRNLSYGRLNDDNKIAIASDHGLPQLLHLLRVSRVTQLRELVTGILWNLSSCEELKLRIIKNSLNDIVSYVLIPYSGWSEDMARNPIAQPSQIHWNAELRNSTGTLRNVSSAGEPARVFMRSCAGLVDALLWTIQSAVKLNNDIDNKTIENAICILRNLSYRLENEIDPQEGADDVLDQEWEKEQRRELEEDIRVIQRSQRPQHRSWLTMCVRPSRSTLQDNSYNPSQFVRKDAPLPRRHQPVFGIALLWQPEVVHPYLSLIKSSSNPDTLEGACGAIHNLTACSWKWASYVRNVVRNSKGLPIIITLLEANHDPVIRAATTALRNLAIDPRNKAIIGEQAMEGLTTRLPFGPRHIGLSDSTTIAILCALIELITESPQNAKLFRSRSGVLLAVKLARSKQHVPKIVFAANKLCSVLSDYKEGYSALKREGWDISHYTRAAKDTGYSLEFEPKSISKDFRTSVHIKSNKKRKEKDYSKSATSLEDRAGIELPPSPVPSNATTNLGIERQSSPALNFEPNYDMVDSTRQKPTSQSVPNLGTMGTYAVIPEDPTPSKDQQGSGDVGHFDPNAVYAQVDKNKKRGTRRSSGKDDLPPTQHAPYPVDETAGGDSWV